MGKLLHDRRALDAALVDPSTAILLIFGWKASEDADRVYRAARGIRSAGQLVFLVLRHELLADDEHHKWKSARGDYAILARSTHRVVATGKFTELFQTGQRPSLSKLRSLFYLAEHGPGGTDDTGPRYGP